jgi:threonine dehydratase
MALDTETAPTLEAIRETRERLGDLVFTTPVRLWDDDSVVRAVGRDTNVFLKEELFQRTGSFKPRGALSNMFALSLEELARGVTAVSAGNHAIGVAYAAKVMGTTAKVVILKSVNPMRLQACRDLGAEIEIAEDGQSGFARVEKIQEEEGRVFIHPFEGLRTALGTATVGLELCEQVADLDAVIVPIGGGGLCAGISTAVKRLRPQCQVFGVEPRGADTMHRSFAAGTPQSIDRIDTIADSLGAPFAARYTFELCRRYVDDLVLVDDDQLRAAMYLLFRSAKLAVEPAGAAATAALCGPLRERLAGKRVGLIVCGANVDPATFGKHLLQATGA